VRSYLDSYALIEIIKANPSFSEFVKSQCVTSIFNYAEAYHHLLSVGGKKQADLTDAVVAPMLAEIPLECIREAMAFRLEFNSHPENKRRKLSFADAICYTYAQSVGMDFVTGDEAFRGLKGDRFIKQVRTSFS
jgi:predicted nucleic acid-binding protein